MKWFEKILNIDEENIFDPFYMDLRPKRVLSGTVKLFLPIIGPYYDGKDMRNPYHGDDVGSVLKDGLDITVSGLLYSYIAYGSEPNAMFLWGGISVANFVAWVLGYKTAVKEEINGKRHYSGTDGRTILE